MSPPHSGFMQREVPSMEGITTTTDNKPTKKQKTTHDQPETNVSFDLLGIAIQGSVRMGGSYKKRKLPLGTKTNPFTVVPRKEKNRQGGYYMQNDILRFWNQQEQIMYLLCDLCDFKCKRMDHFKRHKTHMHEALIIGTKNNPFTSVPRKKDRKEGYYMQNDILRFWNQEEQIMYLLCDLCDFKCKRTTHLKSHKSHMHEALNIKKRQIGGDGTKDNPFIFLPNTILNSHNRKVGCYYLKDDILRYWDVDEKLYYLCNRCTHRSIFITNVKRHKSFVHNIDVTWYHCDKKGCNQKFKMLSHVARHKYDCHNIGVTWHHCDVDNCNFKTKRPSNLSLHKQWVHEIGVTWHYCEECTERCKSKTALRKHKTIKHDIDVTWHYCNVEGCNYKCKQTYISYLKSHKARVHDIGNLECGICYKMCGKVVSHEFTYGQSTLTGTIDICRQCCRDYGLKKDRIEHRYMQRLDESIDFPSHDDQMVKGEACFRYRPDRLYLGLRVIIHIECDEHQHWSMGSYTCEEQRISDIYDEFANDVPDHYVVIRFNPDEYDKNDGDREEVFEERARHLAEIIQYVRENPPPEKVSIIYMYYSENNPQITQRWPKYFIDDEKSVSW